MNKISEIYEAITNVPVYIMRVLLAEKEREKKTEVQKEYLKK